MNTSTPIYGDGQKKKFDCSALTNDPSTDAVELSEYMTNLNSTLGNLLANRNVTTATNLIAILRQQVSNHLGITYTPRAVNSNRGVQTEGAHVTLTSK